MARRKSVRKRFSPRTKRKSGRGAHLISKIRLALKRKPKAVARIPYKRIRKNGFTIKRPRISATRIERGLRVLSETGDITTAARSIRVSPETFKSAAGRKKLIRKRRGRWKVVAALPRRMPIFTNGRQLAITVRSKTAALIGQYNSAVGKFLRTNKPEVLAEFKGRIVKDTRGKEYVLTINPNELYRLSSAGGEPFEAVYKIII